MKIRLSLFLLLHFQVIQLHGQALDSLKDRLSITENDADRIVLLYQIGNVLLAERNLESITYFEQAIEMGKKSNDRLSIARAYNRLGIVWYHQNDLQKSSQFYFDALEYTDDHPTFYDIRLHIFNNLGWNFKRLNDPVKALEYFRKAEDFSRMKEFEYSLGSLLNNIGVVLKDLGKYEESFATLSESLILNENTNSTNQVRYNLNNMGVVLFNLKRYDEAIETLEKVLEMNLNAKDTIEIINNYMNLGASFNKVNRAQEAKDILESALQFKTNLNPDYEGQIYLELDDVLAKLGDFETARIYLNKYIQLMDSLQELNIKESIFELEAKYNSLLKDKDLEEARKNLAEQKLFLAIFISGFIIMLLFAILFWRNYHQKNRSEAKLKSLYEELESQSQKLKQSNEQISKINENLETIIQQRTSVIESQNQRLIRFAFMNSHKIRGPVATLLGLISLLEDDRHKDMQVGLIVNAKDTIKKLDAIIHEVNNQLQSEGIEPEN